MNQKRNQNFENTLLKQTLLFCFVLSQCMSHLGLNLNIYTCTHHAYCVLWNAFSGIDNKDILSYLGINCTAQSKDTHNSCYYLLGGRSRGALHSHLSRNGNPQKMRFDTSQFSI